MITRAYVQEEGSGRLGVEGRDLIEGLRILGIAAELFTRKQIARRSLSLDRSTLVAGDLPSVLGALRQQGIEPPPPNDYPKCLGHLMHRRVWPSTVRHLKESLFDGASPPCFAKPASRQKRFTGRVFDTCNDLFHLEGASGSTAIHCSETVNWTSEHRVYVVRSHVVGIGHYAGDPSVLPDKEVVSEAVYCLHQSGEETAGYGLDLGVLDNGRTALVEWNDGFSLGSYGLEANSYAELILARWCELVR